MFLLLDTIVAGWRRRVVFYRETGLGAARLGGDTSHKLIPVRKLSVEIRHVQHRGFRNETYYRLSSVSRSTTVQYTVRISSFHAGPLRISWSAPKRTAQHTHTGNNSTSYANVSFCVFVHNQFCQNITICIYCTVTLPAQWICKRSLLHVCSDDWITITVTLPYVIHRYTRIAMETGPVSLLLNRVLSWKFWTRKFKPNERKEIKRIPWDESRCIMYETKRPWGDESGEIWLQGHEAAHRYRRVAAKNFSLCNSGLF